MSYQPAMQAALAGEGVVLGWALTSHLLRRNKLLVRPLKEEVRTDKAFFVIANDRASKLDEMKLLVQWVVEEAQAS